MFEIIRGPWHWAVAGSSIGLIVPALLILGNKKFGVSSSLRHVCAMCVPAKIPFFNYNWKKEAWNLFFVAGILLGAFLATQFLSNPDGVVISEATQSMLAGYGITDYSKLMPIEIFSHENIFTLKGLFFFAIGGFLVGFGTRYAGGCTSGHAIMGISTLQWPSLVATVCFMIGGFISANFIVPFIFSLV